MMEDQLVKFAAPVRPKTGSALGATMRGQISLLALIIATISTSYADDTGQGYGLGMRSCAAFASDYAANPTVAEATYFAWAEGFMSGLNFMAAVNKMPSRHIAGGNESMHSYQIYIRSFCDNHPLANYADAVAKLWNTLPAVLPDSN